MDIKKELARYVQYWPWFLLCLFCIGSAYFYLKYAPRIYESTAKIKVLDEKEGLELPTAGIFLNRSNINLENEIEILGSYIILEKVVKRLKLNIEIYEVGRIQTTQRDGLPFYFETKKDIPKQEGLGAFTIVINNNNFTVTPEGASKSVVFSNHDSFKTKHDLPFEIQFRE